MEKLLRHSLRENGQPFERYKSVPARLSDLLIAVLAYAIPAYGTLMVSSIEGTTSPFWPSTGIALFLCLTRGPWAWPAIFIGYMLGTWNLSLSLFTHVSAGLIATVEPIVAAYVLRWALGRRPNLERVHDILIFVALAVIAVPLATASMTINTLLFSGSVSTESAPILWRTFFIGDALGILIFTPLLLALRNLRFILPRINEVMEALALMASTALLATFVFTQAHPIAFLLFPPIFWAALRFRTLGTSATVLLLTMFGLHFTTHGRGPFQLPLVEDRLALFQLFASVSSVTGLVLSTVAGSELRRRTFAQVAAARTRFQVAAQNASDLIYEWDLETNALHWWGRIGDALGIGGGATPNDFAAFKSIIHPDDRERVLSGLKAHITKEGPLRQEYRVLKKDGSTAYWTDSGQVIEDLSRDARLWIGVITDVTETRLAEEALRHSEERYQAATSAADIGVWESPPGSNRGVEWSPVVARLFGTTKTELTAEEAFLLVHPDDRRRAREVIASARQKHESTFTFDFRVIRPDGTPHWLQARGRYFYDENGQVIRSMGTVQDITAEKHILDELKRAKDEAEAASRAKMQFLANMSHEIRTPMNAILGFAELLTSSEPGNEQKRDFAERIKVNGDQLLALINDILDLSKFEAGDIPIEHLRFSLIDVVMQVIKNLTPLAERKHLAIRVEFKTAVPQVVTSDPTRLRQVLTNLIGNSVKFTEQGSITVRLSYRPVKDSHHGEVSIDIEDTGIGISAEAQRRLFQPFSQGDNSVTRRFGGSGLGLVLSRRLAQALGGSLTLTHSTPGRGSCFTITLDVGDVSRSVFVNEASLSHHAIAAPNSAGGKLRSVPRGEQAGRLKGLKVLLAEDSPDNEALVRLYLNMDGAEVFAAHDGEEAMRMATSGNPFDIVLMDVQMPRMDGLEATRRLRARGFTKPVIALTAHALQEEVRKSLDAGCNAHLTKPINRSKLISAISDLSGRPAEVLSSPPN